MDLTFIVFATFLGLLALAYVGYFISNLINVSEVGPGLRSFVMSFVTITGTIALVGGLAGILLSPSVSDWSIIIAAVDLTVMLLVLAGIGFSIGFRQMEEDGVGYLRFFQLGSSIVLVLAIAPAFFAFITYATRIN